MPLYLLEMKLDVSTPQKRDAIIERIEQVVKAGGSPNARLVAGPWVSQENPTLLAVFDNPDLTKSLPARMALYNAGLVTDVRLRPIIDWEGAKAAAKAAG